MSICDPTDCSMPGLPVHYYLLEWAQTQVHWVSDAIQPSHSLPSFSPPTFDLSQHQGLFQWAGSLHQVAKVLELQLHHQSSQWIVKDDFLLDWLVWSPCCPRNSQEFSSTVIPKPQFFGASAFMVLLSRPYVTTGKTIAFPMSAKWCTLLFNYSFFGHRF